MLALAFRTVMSIHAVPSDSMAPVLLPGDRILVTRFVSDTPARGDVVVFRDPVRHELTVKRVVAISGDVVESVIVPEDHLFVMGDNRLQSLDSRHWGPLPQSLVLGRARLILWRSGRTRRIFKWIE